MANEKVRHPPGLFVLFGTEAAERFSFYTMRAILVLYLARIILPGVFTDDAAFRAELTAALEKDPRKFYTDTVDSFDRKPLRLVYETVLAKARLLPELRGLPDRQPGTALPATAIEGLRGQETALRALFERSYTGEALTERTGQLKAALDLAYGGRPVEEFADRLRDLAAEPLTGELFATAFRDNSSDLEAILDTGFTRQNMRITEEKNEPMAFAQQALGPDVTESRGLVEWVVSYRIKTEIRPEALSIYGLYLLLVYLCGLIGGYVADKILGSRKAILMGGIVMGLGLFVMWWPGLVFYGLALIIAGNAFFKPNISTIVSGLYPEGDKRRDPAFTIFYMGINLGAFIAIFGAGYAESLSVANDWGWNVGFVLAGVGMIFSLILFLLGQKHLGTAGFPPNREVSAESRLTGGDFRDVAIWAVGVSFAAVALIAIWGVIGPVWNGLPSVVRLVIGAALIGGAIYGLRRSSRSAGGAANSPLSIEEWQQVAVILILSIFVIFFWAGFEQAGGTMNLFAYEQTDRHIGSWEMPATWFQGFNPLFIIVLAPLFSMFWSWSDQKSWGLSTPAKMGVGMIVLGLGFVVMFFGQAEADASGKAGLMWLVVVYLIHTVGELCLSPIGLSMVTKLSPVRIVSLMMGVWFACTAVADYLSGRLEEIVHHFGFSLWATLFTIPIGAGILLLMLTPLLRRWMHDRC